MLSLLGLLFFFVLALIFLGLTVVSGILRALFGMGRRAASSARRPSAGDGSHRTQERTTPKRKKLIKEDEGEYVTFEEVTKDKR
jgi:hypothetical protein